MEPTLEDYIDVRLTAKELGLGPVAQFSILPRGFSDTASLDGLTHESDAATLEKFFREEGLELKALQPSTGRLPVIVERQYEWVAPVLFLGYELLLNHRQGVTDVLRVLQTFFEVYVRRRLPAGRVKLELVIETRPREEYKKLTFDGSPKNLGELRELVSDLLNE